MKLLRISALVILAAVAAHAQNRTRFAGIRNAWDYAYGVNQNVPYLQVAPGGNNTVTGTQTLTLLGCFITAGDGTTFFPLSTNAPVIVDIGANAETVTPTAVSPGSPLVGSGTCTLTASFNKIHGVGAIITSGTFGLQETINLQAFGQTGFGQPGAGQPGPVAGGVVAVDGAWAAFGGTNSTITGSTPFSNVYIFDNRGVTPTYWEMQPTTLTLMSAPTTLTSTTVASATACQSGFTCTWTASSVFACITLVDALGGEGPCSATFNFTATASVPVTFSAPLGTLTGAVGWRAYAGASYAAATVLPLTGGGSGTVTTAGTAVTWVSGSQFLNTVVYPGGPIIINGSTFTISTVNSATSITLTASAGTQATAVPYTATGTCTALATQESVIPACALTATATFPLIYTTTAQLLPAPVPPVAASNSPVTQGHTTFGWMQTPIPDTPYQGHYGPFAAMTGGTTAGQVASLGSMQLPVGYLNYIGRTIRVSGKMIVATAATTTTPSILVKLGWQGGDTAGAPVTVCTMTTTSALGVAGTYNIPFSCTMTTNAVGNTAVGTIQTDGWASFAIQGGTTAAVNFVDTGTAAIGSLGLFSQDTVYVYFTGATSTTSSLQLMDLHVETLQ